MIRQFKIVVEKNPDGYIAYPLGLKGVVVGQGNTMRKPWQTLNRLFIFISRLSATKFSNIDLLARKP